MIGRLADGTTLRLGARLGTRIWLYRTNAESARRCSISWGSLVRARLARAVPAGSAQLRNLERKGREIGRELAQHGRIDYSPESFRQALTALGFQPSVDVKAKGRLTCRLENCPYRDSARKNPDVVCTLHCGITTGLLGELDSKARLTALNLAIPIGQVAWWRSRAGTGVSRWPEKPR